MAEDAIINWGKVKTFLKVSPNARDKIRIARLLGPLKQKSKWSRNACLRRQPKVIGSKLMNPWSVEEMDWKKLYKRGF